MDVHQSIALGSQEWILVSLLSKGPDVTGTPWEALDLSTPGFGKQKHGNVALVTFPVRNGTEIRHLLPWTSVIGEAQVAQR